MKLTIVPADSSHLNFIYSSWARQTRYADFARAVPRYIYTPLIKDAMESLLARAEVLVALDPDDSNPATNAMGYLVYEHLPGRIPVVHFAYTKKVMRGFGVMTQLMKVAGISKQDAFLYTTRTPSARHLQKDGARVFPNAVHFPYWWFMRRYPNSPN